MSKEPSFALDRTILGLSILALLWGVFTWGQKYQRNKKLRVETAFLAEERPAESVKDGVLEFSRLRFPSPTEYAWEITKAASIDFAFDWGILGVPDNCWLRSVTTGAIETRIDGKTMVADADHTRGWLRCELETREGLGMWPSIHTSNGWPRINDNSPHTDLAAFMGRHWAELRIEFPSDDKQGTEDAEQATELLRIVCPTELFEQHLGRFTDRAPRVKDGVVLLQLFGGPSRAIEELVVPHDLEASPGIDGSSGRPRSHENDPQQSRRWIGQQSELGHV